MSNSKGVVTADSGKTAGRKAALDRPEAVRADSLKLRRLALQTIARRTTLSEFELLEFLRQLKRGRRRILLRPDQLELLERSGLDLQDLKLLAKILGFEFSSEPAESSAGGLSKLMH